MKKFMLLLDTVDVIIRYFEVSQLTLKFLYVCYESQFLYASINLNILNNRLV